MSSIVEDGVIGSLGIFALQGLLARFLFSRMVERSAGDCRSIDLAFVTGSGLFGGVLWLPVVAAF
ncbi:MULTISPECIES: hypothetical protein [Sphingomonas]|uniref:hypothetical protein n=1 Tax=Sphingomonas TaxID=13687 RepID=UPI000DEF864E|nr:MULTISPECIES: hypothetical protein [Sphingomonas]